MTTLDIDHESPRSLVDAGLRQWIMVGLAGVVLAGVGYWLSAVDARTDAQAERLNAAIERLAAMEATQAATQRELVAIAEGLKQASASIDGKLNNLTSLIVTGSQHGGPTSVQGSTWRFDK